MPDIEYLTDHLFDDESPGDPGGTELLIEATGERDAFGFETRYLVTYHNWVDEELIFHGGCMVDSDRCFRLNGLTDEAVLAVLIHRLKSQRLGILACAETDLAVEAVEAAMKQLHERQRKIGLPGIPAPRSTTERTTP